MDDSDISVKITETHGDEVTIQVRVGYTRSAGDYEFARLDQAIQLTVDKGVDIETTMTSLRTWLEKKTLASVNEMVQNMK